MPFLWNPLTSELNISASGGSGGSGIQSINGNTTAAQVITSDTSGNNVAVASSAGTTTISIPSASATARGVVTTGAQTLAGAKTLSSAPILSSLTADTVPYLNGSKTITSSSVTPTELGYVSGLQSSLQTQLTAKAIGAASSTTNAFSKYSTTDGKTLLNSAFIEDSSQNYLFNSIPVASLPTFPLGITNSHSRYYNLSGDGTADQYAAPAICLINQSPNNAQVDPGVGWITGIGPRYDSPHALAVKSVITLAGDSSRGGAITFRNFFDDGVTSAGGFGLWNGKSATDTGALGSLFPIGFTTIGYGPGSGENFTAWLKLIHAGSSVSTAQNLIQATNDAQVNIGWQLGGTYRHFLQTWDGARYTFINVEGSGSPGTFTNSIGDDATANSTKATSVLHRPANKTAGTGDGGDFTITPGTSSGGVDGKVKLTGSIAFTSKNRIVATNGGSSTIANNIRLTILDPSALIAGYTLTMPSAPIDGQEVNICAGSFGITTLTLSPNSGQSFATGAALTTLAASGFASYIYHTATTTWFRIG